MNKLVYVALLGGGIFLIVFGVGATKSFSSDLSRFLTGSPTGKAIWMLIAGIIAVILGLTGALRRFKPA